MDLISLAIETTCPRGGVCLGRGARIVASDTFDASQRHATHLVSKLKALLDSQGARPGDLNELYVSAGPGSFTGTRVGITVARTLGQAIAGLRCVRVPTPWALAQQALALEWRHLAVIGDTAHGGAHVSFFDRGQSGFEPLQALVLTAGQLLESASRPILVIGEGLKFGSLASALAGAAGIEMPPMNSPFHLPTAEAVWQVGAALARKGQFTPYQMLLPIYSRPPEALRLWQKLHGDE